MSKEAVRTQLSDVFLTGMAANYPTVPIAWENLPFNRPTRSAWVDFRINFGDVAPMEIGAGRHRIHGVINVQIMVPEDTGTKVMNELSDYIFSLLAPRSWSLAGNAGKLVTCSAENRTRPNVSAFACRSIMVEFHHDYQ